MKICLKCLNDLSVDHFNKDNSRKDGLTIYCKDCLKLIRDTNKDSFKEKYDKDYYKIINDNRKDYLKSYYEKKKQI